MMAPGRAETPVAPAPGAGAAGEIVGWPCGFMANCLGFIREILETSLMVFHESRDRSAAFTPLQLPRLHPLHTSKRRKRRAPVPGFKARNASGKSFSAWSLGTSCPAPMRCWVSYLYGPFNGVSPVKSESTLIFPPAPEWQPQRRQNGNDGDDHQQFDQRKPIDIRFVLHNHKFVFQRHSQPCTARFIRSRFP